MLTIEENEIEGKELISQADVNANANVYRATWKGDLVALKEFDTTVYGGVLRYSFESEVKLMSKFEHPYVMSIRGTIGDAWKTPLCYIVMDYMPKGTLADYLKTNEMDDYSKIDMARGIARGLVYLHDNNILHLDLKTDNILIDETEKPKICDFGSSREIEWYHNDDVVTADDQKGTPRWHTPESLESVDPWKNETYKYTRKTDIYTYALVVWSLYSLTKPYETIDDLDEMNKKITSGKHEDETLITEPSLQKLCVRAWSLTPKERPKAEEFVSEFEILKPW